MNEISARCGCKFTFCVNKEALIRWADGSKQNVWRNSQDPRAEIIWGQRRPPDVQAEDPVTTSTPVVSGAVESGRLKRKASTEVPLDPLFSAETNPNIAPAQIPRVQHGNKFNPQGTAQTNLNMTSIEDPYVPQQIHEFHPLMMTGTNLDMTLTEDPLLVEDYEFRRYTDQTLPQNPTNVNDGLEDLALDPNWLDEYLANYDGNLEFNPPNDDLHLRGGGGGQEREAVGSQRRPNGRKSRFRRLLDLYKNPSNSEKVRVVEESSEDEEPYIIRERTTGGEIFAEDHSSDNLPLQPSSNSIHRVSGHAQSTTLHDDVSSGSTSPAGSIESHLTHPRPSEAWPPGTETEGDRSNHSIHGQRRIEPLRVWTKNGKPVRRFVKRQSGPPPSSTGPAFLTRDLFRNGHQFHAPSTGHRHVRLGPPRGGHSSHHAGSFEHHGPLRQAEPLVPLHQFRRPLRQRNVEIVFQGNDRIVPSRWLRRSRIAYMLGFASFLLVLLSMNSVSWAQLLLVLLITFAAVWLMED
ncbi:hypothetical protein MMC18_003115 [Xylographa bjoerkii]|nr:hypothetical protein [Xylographa bjoerkii]